MCRALECEPEVDHGARDREQCVRALNRFDVDIDDGIIDEKYNHLCQ